MRQTRILVTGAGRRVELLKAFRQAALVLNRELKIYGADMAGTAPALLYCDETRRVAAMRDPAYISQLLEICRNDEIDLLIPTIDTDLLILSENRERFETIGTKVLISRSEMIRICRDKNLTSRFFVDCGLKAPMPVNDYRAYTSGYPAFIKPKDGSSSINAFKVKDETELAEYAGRIDDYVIQPFVDGTEYTIDIFCDLEGNPISIVPRERMAVRAGEVLKTKICMDEKMIREAKRLIEVFRPCGPITVQLIREKTTGDDYYIEINPRFGGGAPLSMKAGARSAEAILKMLTSEGDEAEKAASKTSAEVLQSMSADIADGAIYSRFDDSVCIDPGHVPERVKGVIFDLDDTLYPEREYVRSGYRAVTRVLGEAEETASDSSANYEDRLWNYFEEGQPAIDRLLQELNRNEEKEACLAAYRGNEPDIHLYPGVKELLTELRKQGVRVGIITDGRPDGQKKKIKALGLEKLVDDIIITDELGGVQFRKPCDIAFRIMQMRWRLAPEQMVYVGDNIGKDFKAPLQLGMQGLYFNNPEGLYTAGFGDGSALGSGAEQDDIIKSSINAVSDFMGVAKRIRDMMV